LRFAGVERALPEAIAQAQAEGIKLFERRRSGFIELAPEIRIGDFFEHVKAIGEAADRPGLVGEKALPVAREHDKNKSHNHANAERHPQNFHLPAFPGPCAGDSPTSRAKLAPTKSGATKFQTGTSLRGSMRVAGLYY